MAGLLAGSALVLLPMTPAHAAGGADVFFERTGTSQAGRFGWTQVGSAGASVPVEIHVCNYAGGVAQIRFEAHFRIGGTYYRYKDTFVGNNYCGKWKVLVDPSATTVRLKAGYYTSAGSYTGYTKTSYWAF